MRYANVQNIIFATYLGDVITIKDFYEIPTSYQKATSVKISAGTLLDEVANRREIYGQDSENSIYKILEFNKTAIFEAGFDLDKVRTLEIPVP